MRGRVVIFIKRSPLLRSLQPIQFQASALEPTCQRVQIENIIPRRPKSGRKYRAVRYILPPHIHNLWPGANPATKTATHTSSSLPTLSKPVSQAQPDPDGRFDPTPAGEEEWEDEGHGNGEQCHTRHSRDGWGSLCDDFVFGRSHLSDCFGDVVVAPDSCC
jgi:hypothetical protein